ncbi:predicted protein [Nematostella vectensis]|uniref:DUF6729 domain-containing protein n=1 Tax=Nematostella vectensis TaxID=45351 RepID=A7SE16_NEMVE|nr:predicted protein [Nematostella vectensis]|eukprot:XP_001630092.1 predicted protein [Nematostella vectensis]
MDDEGFLEMDEDPTVPTLLAPRAFATAPSVSEVPASTVPSSSPLRCSPAPQVLMSVMTATEGQGLQQMANGLMRSPLSPSSLNNQFPNPDYYFAQPLLLWMPRKLWKVVLKCPQEGCNRNLTSAGLYQKTRQVVDIDGNYNLAAEYLECGQCKKKVISWSPAIVSQLDPGHKLQFQVILTYKYACDVRVVRMLRNRGLGNSSSMLHKKLTEQHSEKWLQKTIHVENEARARVREAAGDASNTEWVLSNCSLQFGIYRGKTFIWLLSNDCGWAVMVLASHETKRAIKHPQGDSQWDNKEALRRYAHFFPPLVDAIQDRINRELGRADLGAEPVGFGPFGQMTGRVVLASKSPEHIWWLQQISQLPVRQPGSSLDAFLQYARGCEQAEVHSDDADLNEALNQYEQSQTAPSSLHSLHGWSFWISRPETQYGNELAKVRSSWKCSINPMKYQPNLRMDCIACILVQAYLYAQTGKPWGTVNLDPEQPDDLTAEEEDDMDDEGFLEMDEDPTVPTLLAPRAFATAPSVSEVPASTVPSSSPLRRSPGPSDPKEEDEDRERGEKNRKYLTECAHYNKAAERHLVSRPNYEETPTFNPPPKYRWLLSVYALDIMNRMDQIKASITSTFGTILKMDSTKKIVKLSGHSAGTAAWCTNIGNENGHVLMSVLTATEGQGLQQMANGLMRSDPRTMPRKQNNNFPIGTYAKKKRAILEELYEEKVNALSEIKLQQQNIRRLKEKVENEARARVREAAGDASNTEWVLSNCSLQFGIYRGKTFIWLLSNDCGWAVMVLASHETKRAIKHPQGDSQWDNKEALRRYAHFFPPLVYSIQDRINYELGRVDLGAEPVGFGPFGQKTRRAVLASKSPKQISQLPVGQPGSSLDVFLQYARGCEQAEVQSDDADLVEALDQYEQSQTDPSSLLPLEPRQPLRVELLDQPVNTVKICA